MRIQAVKKELGARKMFVVFYPKLEHNKCKCGLMPGLPTTMTSEH